MPSLPVKVYRNNEIRRLRLETGDEDGRFGFQRLVNKINHLFPDLAGNTVRLAWKDADGELVSMGSNPELREAVQNLPADGQVLRVYVLNSEKVQEPAPESKNDQPEMEIPIEQEEPAKTEEPVEEDPTLHRHVVCDGCEGAIRGIRFKCLTCPDYDLCAECMEKAPHDDHPTIRITSPKDFSWKHAFIASQGFAGFFPGRQFGSGRCHGRRCRRWAEKCQAQNQESEQKVEEPKEPKKDAEPGLFSEEVIKDLSETIESVLSALGISTTGQAETPKQENAPPAAKEGKADEAASTDAHPDPKIAAALNYMLAMGYRNDGGWLTKLLEEKRGDVSAVLDIIHPTGQK